MVAVYCAEFLVTQLFVMGVVTIAAVDIEIVVMNVVSKHVIEDNWVAYAFTRVVSLIG